MLNSLFTTAVSSVDISSILFCTLASFVLGIVIATTHRLTSKCTRGFLITLAILPILVQSVIIMVNGNLGTSVAILGAFGLVRFRSLPGTSKEILSVFFAMSVGLATGMGHIGFAVIITAVVALAIVALDKMPIFAIAKATKHLKITIPGDLDYTNVFNEIFAQYLTSFHLEKAKTTDMGSLFDLNYSVVLKPDTNEKALIDAIRERNGNLRVVLSDAMPENGEI